MLLSLLQSYAIYLRELEVKTNLTFYFFVIDTSCYVLESNEVPREYEPLPAYVQPETSTSSQLPPPAQQRQYPPPDDLPPQYSAT